MPPSPSLFYEKKLHPSYPHIAGLDEAGRGALAGPVCVGAVILPLEEARILHRLSGVRDSKQLSPRQREQLAPQIERAALAYGVGFSSAGEVDELGIVAATRLAAARALAEFSTLPDFLLTDFRLDLPELDLPQAALVKGDQISLSIASASILAKTARDRLMTNLDLQYLGYGFSKHKGYGTLAHRKAILRMGFSPVHRKTFAVKDS